MSLKKQNRISARHLITLSCLGTAGFWAASSNRLAARLLRDVLSERGRRMVPPKFHPDPGRWDPDAITAAWLGHSTVLINFFGLTILTDPVLFRRVGANLRIGTIGPRRLIAPALTVQQLPPIDVVLLSHAHMDHLDLPTLKCLPAATRAVTAQATGDLLARTRMRRVVELGWGQKTTLATPKGTLEVRAFEVAHWGARWRHDMHRGYNGYVLAREGKKIIFGGDTALSPAFKGLRHKGPFELAIMPIGAYQPWQCSHCTPEQAVRMANEAGASYFLPIHHQTFPLGRERRAEPLERLEAALERERIALREVGQTFSC